MSDCNSNKPFNVRFTVPPVAATVDAIEYEVVGVSPIKVVKTTQVTASGKPKVIFTVSYSPSVPPKCSITVSPTTGEIGVSQTYTFTYSDIVGSSTIVTRTKTPSISPVVLLFNQAGVQGIHNYVVVDSENQSCSSQVGINVKYRFFKGTIERNAVPDNAFFQAQSSALGASISEAFPRQAYTMDKQQGHFIWFYPADFASIPTPTGDANLPFQIVDIPGTWTLNGISYKAAKTSSYFSLNGTATLGF